MPDPIVFKCEDSLWRMLQQGTKRFDMRRWDLADARIERLCWGHRLEQGPTISPYAGGLARGK